MTARGIVDLRPDGLDQLHVALLDLVAGLVGISGDEVDVQLQGRRAGLLHLLGQCDPPPGRDAVQRCDHRDLELAGTGFEVTNVRVGSRVVLADLRQVREGFGVGVGREVEGAVELELVVLDLLFEQGRKHDRPRTRVLQDADRVALLSDR